MSVLIYVDSDQNQFKKTAFELATYGSKLAKKLSTDCIAIVINCDDSASLLGKYGVSKVVQLNDENLEQFDSRAFAHSIATIAKSQESNIVILSNNANGRSIIGRLSVLMNAGIVSGVSGMVDTTDGFVVNKSVYSGKGIAHYNITSENKVISLMPNAIQIEEEGSTCPIESVQIDIPERQVTVLSKSSVEGIVPLPEAEIVVSGGRGLKGPENWSILEELATKLGATLACSRPVADSDWRPHHEHVGQTGVAIRPKLYIAIGISGAIQHLAGVNNSKVMVVINKDPEAPFFKAADYGVCADLFDVVPRLSVAIEKFKQD